MVDVDREVGMPHQRDHIFLPHAVRLFHRKRRQLQKLADAKAGVDHAKNPIGIRHGADSPLNAGAFQVGKAILDRLFLFLRQAQKLCIVFAYNRASGALCFGIDAQWENKQIY